MTTVSVCFNIHSMDVDCVLVPSQHIKFPRILCGFQSNELQKLSGKLRKILGITSYQPRFRFFLHYEFVTQQNCTHWISLCSSVLKETIFDNSCSLWRMPITVGFSLHSNVCVLVGKVLKRSSMVLATLRLTRNDHKKRMTRSLNLSVVF